MEVVEEIEGVLLVVEHDDRVAVQVLENARQQKDRLAARRALEVETLGLARMHSLGKALDLGMLPVFF